MKHQLFDLRNIFIQRVQKLKNDVNLVLCVPKSSESQVEVSVPVTLVANVDADSVDVLIVVSAVEATELPITITCFCCEIKSIEQIKRRIYIYFRIFFEDFLRQNLCHSTFSP